MDRDYQRLHESIRHGEARKKGFNDFEPSRLERFLSCFDFELIGLPRKRVIVNPFKGLKPDELLGKIKKAKKFVN